VHTVLFNSQIGCISSQMQTCCKPNICIKNSEWSWNNPTTAGAAMRHDHDILWAQACNTNYLQPCHFSNQCTVIWLFGQDHQELHWPSLNISGLEVETLTWPVMSVKAHYNGKEHHPDIAPFRQAHSEW
jgi:hypothetical protein